MDTTVFIKSYQQAFGTYELSLVLWYSHQPEGSMKKTRGCFIKDLKSAREGAILSNGLSGKCFEMPNTIYTKPLAFPVHKNSLVFYKQHFLAGTLISHT
jgi:hypothetical protein